MAGELAGWRVAVTRPADQAGSLTELLEAAGAAVVGMPLIRVVAPTPRADLQAAVQRASGYDWLIFTSANAVRAFVSAVAQAGIPVQELQACRCAAVGPATAVALENAGLHAQVVPDAQVGAALADAMAAAGLAAGTRVLWPRAGGASDSVTQFLRARGAHVDDVVAYRTVADPGRGSELRALVVERKLDVLTFMSPSAVRAYAGPGGERAPQAPVVAVIGPVTGQAARNAGMAVQIEAREHSVQGLVDDLVRYRLET